MMFTFDVNDVAELGRLLTPALEKNVIKSLFSNIFL